MKRRNSQFGILLRHGSEGEHEASVGAEQSAVSHRGDGAASRRPPARAKESGLQSLTGLFHHKRKEESRVDIYRKHSNGGILNYYGRGNQICVPARCKMTLLSSRDFHLLPPAAVETGLSGDLCLGYSSRQMKKLIQLLSNPTIWLSHGKQGNSVS